MIDYAKKSRNNELHPYRLNQLDISCFYFYEVALIVEAEAGKLSGIIGYSQSRIVFDLGEVWKGFLMNGLTVWQNNRFWQAEGVKGFGLQVLALNSYHLPFFFNPLNLQPIPYIYGYHK